MVKKCGHFWDLHSFEPTAFENARYRKAGRMQENSAVALPDEICMPC